MDQTLVKVFFFCRVKSGWDFLQVLELYAAKCEVFGMRVSTSKPEAIVLRWKTEDCFLQEESESFSQVMELKYLKVLFKRGGKINCEVDRHVGAAAAKMQMIHLIIVVVTEMLIINRI